MTHELKDAFDKAFDIEITTAKANAVIKFVDAYETRDTNPLAYNTYSLGVHKCLFLTSDRDDFFNLFNNDNNTVHRLVEHLFKGTNRICGITKRDIDNLAKQNEQQLRSELLTHGISASDIRKVLSSVNSVDTNYKVATDSFNLFTVYVLYCISRANIQQRLKDLARFKVIMLLQYRFFTSLVNHRFPYQANAELMAALFESLTNKFDIKRYGTWKKVMEARATAILQPDSIHIHTLENFDDDKKIIYFLSDVQTRIRNQINLIVAEFMKLKDERDTYGSYSATAADKETGEKVLVDSVSHFDLTCSNVYNDTLSVAKFLDPTAIRLIVSMFSNLNTTAFRNFLVNFSDKAVRDYKAKTSMSTLEKDGKVYLTGAEILITELIQKSYRYCIQNRVDVNKPVQVLKTMKDAFSASRVLDEGIVQLRDSVALQVVTLQKSMRDAFVSSLRIGFMLYILLLSFKYLK